MGFCFSLFRTHNNQQQYGVKIRGDSGLTRLVCVVQSASSLGISICFRVQSCILMGIMMCERAQRAEKNLNRENGTPAGHPTIRSNDSLTSPHTTSNDRVFLFFEKRARRSCLRIWRSTRSKLVGCISCPPVRPKTTRRTKQATHHVP